MNEVAEAKRLKDEMIVSRDTATTAATAATVATVATVATAARRPHARPYS